MSGRETSEVEGTVTEALPNARFKIELGDGSQVVAHVSASLRLGAGRIIPGNRVRVALSRFDRSRGRITQRSR
ncbi:MAG TPA: translation initiation factor IF-1 [Chloroflexota bacterium]|nr:translation initiation factor IF-1 [Chloroflexota bacterium]